MRGWLVVALLVGSVSAAEYHLSPTGDDAGDGTAARPWKSCRLAVAAAGPGDTIVLAPGLYRDQLTFHNRGGAPGRPIIIEGQGATLTGCDAVSPAEVVPAGPGRWRLAAPKMPEVMIIDGVFARQGRLPGHRGKPESLPEPEALEPGQWTWRGGQVTVRTDTATPPALEICVRDAGFRTSGQSSHFLVRNLNCRHFWNDGFNIHGRCRDLRFEQITGYENMDEGFSIHEWCQTEVVGAEFWGNDNGVADVNRSLSSYHQTACHDNVEVGFLFTGGRHQVIDSSSERDGTPVRVGPGEKLPDDDPATNLLATADVIFSHCRLVAPPEKGAAMVLNGRVVFQHCTLVDAWPSITRGPTRLEGCLLAGQPERLRYAVSDPVEGANQLVDTLVALGPIQVQGTRYLPGDWPQLVARLGLGPRTVQQEFTLDDAGRPVVAGQPLKMSGGPGYWGAQP